jgi:hypothetical protein
VIQEKQLAKLLLAKVECDAQLAPDRAAVGRQIVKALAPVIMKIIRQEIAEAKRGQG